MRKSATHVLNEAVAAASKFKEDLLAKEAEKEKRDALFGGALPPPTAVTQQKVLQDAIKKAAEVQETQAAKANARKSFETNVLSGITAAATEVEATGEARRSHRKSFEASVLSELSDKVKSDEP